MGRLVRLLLNPKTARAFCDWMTGIWLSIQIFVGDVTWDRFQRWFWNTPQEQSQILQESPINQESFVNGEVDALFGRFQHYMDTQYEVTILRNQMLALPPLPDEGY